MLFVQRAFTAKVYRYQAALQSFDGDFPFVSVLLGILFAFSELMSTGNSELFYFRHKKTAMKRFYLSLFEVNSCLSFLGAANQVAITNDLQSFIFTRWVTITFILFAALFY